MLGHALTGFTSNYAKVMKYFNNEDNYYTIHFDF